MSTSRHDRSFPPISRPDAHTLVLGSLPGRLSLEKQQYYAHPRNAFWKIIEQIFETGAELDYDARARVLMAHGIALWDVFAAAERPGSLDSAIVHATAEANDFAAFFREHPRIRRVFFNGKKSEDTFRKQVWPAVAREFPEIELTGLPSTSPAHAGMTFAQKISRWRAIRAPL